MPMSSCIRGLENARPFLFALSCINLQCNMLYKAMRMFSFFNKGTLHLRVARPLKLLHRHCRLISQNIKTSYRYLVLKGVGNLWKCPLLIKMSSWLLRCHLCPHWLNCSTSEQLLKFSHNSDSKEDTSSYADFLFFFFLETHKVPLQNPWHLGGWNDIYIRSSNYCGAGWLFMCMSDR